MPLTEQRGAAERCGFVIIDPLESMSSSVKICPTEIRPSGTWPPIGLRELWAYRELLYFLVWRDIKVRYKQTAIGAAWAVIQPLFTMAIFAIFFGKLAGIQSEGLPYPIFAYTGLLPWMFFANAISNSGNSLIENSALVTEVYFPRIMIPAGSVVAGLVDLLIASLILIPLMFYYQVGLTWQMLMLVLLVPLTLCLALGVGTYVAALNVKYRDIRYAFPFFLQLWLFVSPVIYPSSMIPGQFRWVLRINPITGIIEGFRACLLGSKLDWGGLGISVVLTLVIFTYSVLKFHRMEKSFADII